MHLEGSCHCGAVEFSLTSAHPYPYQRCYCSICRKTQGGGGYAINLSGDATTLKVKGRENITLYHARIRQDHHVDISEAERHFCKHCGSGLWLFSPQWPELIHPFASAIDTPLPTPPESTHILLDSKASWVEVDAKDNDQKFEGYPQESIAAWHERLGLVR
ncbi:GFA family protein [Pseudomonas sp. JDS28PS106]|uniref:GFA family protein n=1 Tax=Pseudomonas sp. JDS28PS106 TaxID=2497235 RepID=UPI002FD0A9B2